MTTVQATYGELRGDSSWQLVQLVVVQQIMPLGVS